MAAKAFIEKKCHEVGACVNPEFAFGYQLTHFHDWYSLAFPSSEPLPGLESRVEDNQPDLSVYTSLKLKTTNEKLGWLPSQFITLGLCSGRKEWNVKTSEGAYQLSANSALNYYHLLVAASLIRHWQKYGAPVRIIGNGTKWESAVSAFLGQIAKDLQGRRKEGRTSKPSGSEINRVRQAIEELVEWNCLSIFTDTNGEEKRRERISFFENITYARKSTSKLNEGKGIGRFELELSNWLIKKFDGTRALKPFYWAKNKKDFNCEGLRVDMKLAARTALHDSSKTRAEANGRLSHESSRKVARKESTKRLGEIAKRDAMKMMGRALTDAYKHPEAHLQENAKCFAWHRTMASQPLVSVFARVTQKQFHILNYLGLTDKLHSQPEIFLALNQFIGSRMAGMTKEMSEKNILMALGFIEEHEWFLPEPPPPTPPLL